MVCNGYVSTTPKEIEGDAEKIAKRVGEKLQESRENIAMEDFTAIDVGNTQNNDAAALIDMNMDDYKESAATPASMV